ncbi:MAG TPA: HAMP domain-containing sensor histidine kinase [Gammaproteobacteria bacterium]|nr:HAMP domain-containing sensor histidine kinase [Gammaproteobacteria bacterium]
MRPRTLPARLSIALFGLLLLLSLGIIGFVLLSAPMFLQEINQKLNLDLAENMVREKDLLADGKVNREALNSIFMGMMVVNPAIEVYLIGVDGRILAYAAPDSVVQRETIDLEPVRAFIEQRQNLPVLGSDPRDADGNKIFSAAPITRNGKLEGYLYIVLAGQAYDSVVDLIESNYVVRLWIAAVAVSLLLALLAGIVIVRIITRRVGALAEGMQQFRDRGFQQTVALPPCFDGRPGDEIDRLGASFREMSERIVLQLRQLQNNDTTRRELVANVSHDLRTPLASLQGYLETLEQRGEQLSAAERRDYIHTAWLHAERLRKLISELFELSRLDSRDADLHFEPFSMSELAQDVSQKFRLAAREKGLELHMEIPPQPAFVSADIGLIQRVLENLIENAIKYTPAGGHVAVSLVAGSDTVTTSVSDTGQGIAAEEIPRIFERFYRVESHRQTEGTGLGLAIASRIMQLHHSHIEVESAPEAGTTFSFPLPGAELGNVERDRNVIFS